MYISVIKIEGFKSFANKVEIPLTKNLNIFIGPNGSGKSNIIDALSFLLGESSRNLRANKNVNLIYQGVKNVKEAYVEVFVNLENKKIKELEELDEINDGNNIVLKRKVKKSGETSYFVNNKKVTKAYFDRILTILKMNTPYNIIFQGDITNVIKSSSKEKRKIIEELANINIFEEKKEKVLKELEDINIKLNAFKATLKEKEKNVIRLKEEKEIAQKFLALEKRKKRLLKGKYIEKLQKIEKKINGINNQEMKIKIMLGEIEKEKIKIENEIANINEKIEEIKSKINEKGGSSVRELEKEMEENIKEIESIKTKISFLEQQIIEIEKIKENYLKKLDNLKDELKTLGAKEKEVIDVIKKLEEKLDVVGSVEIQEDQIINLNKELEKLKEKLFQLKNEKLLVEQNIKETQEIIGIGDIKDLERLNKQLEELINKDSFLSSKIASIKNIIKEKEEKLIKLKSEYEEIMKEIKSNKLINTILKLKDQIEGVYGPLFMLGKVEEKYRKAIEMAGGNRLKAIVVENEDTAKKIIDFLRENKLGVLSFIPLNRIKERKIHYENEEGVIALAADLINFDPKFKKAFYYVFGDTVVVKDFETAKKLKNKNWRMVTLDGELFESSGIISGGYNKSKFHFVDPSIENEIERLENEILSYKRRIEDIRKEKEQLSEQIFHLRIKKKDYESKKDKIKNLDNYKRKKEEIEKELEKVMKEIKLKEEELNKKSKIYREAIDKLKKKNEIISKIKEKENELNLIRERMRNVLNEIKKCEKHYNESILKIEEKKKEISHDKKLLEEKERKNKMLKEKIEELESKLKELFEKRENLFKEINKKKDELIKIEEKIQEIEKNKYGLELRKTTLFDERKKIVEILNQIKEEPLIVENIEEELRNIESELKKIGNVNLKAIEIFDEVYKEYEEFKNKVKKIEEEKDKIINILAEIEEEKRKEFMKVFDAINSNFQKIYSELVEKGKAWLELTNKENIFEGGVEIIVEIANRKFHLKSLSGGEQSLVALSLIFAIQEFKPGMFYAFDEVDAALDKRNARKLAKYLKNYSNRTQFIVISHNEELIVEADYLFGITMDKRTGISKIVSLDLKESGRIINKLNKVDKFGGKSKKDVKIEG